MREILFKAKRLDNNEWVEGDLIQGPGNIKNILHKNDSFSNLKRVIPETVCQYTGFKDIHNKKIFEGDILNCITEDKIKLDFVYDFEMYLHFKRARYYQFDFEITGNIHD